jgi:hypothetical protein
MKEDEKRRKGRFTILEEDPAIVFIPILAFGQ